MNTTSRGRDAEQRIAVALEARGLRVVASNWRTRWCEIDLVATKGKTVYFVEVKYRTHTVWGDGLEAITVKKQQQMRFAAEYWLSTNQWKGEARLCVASLSGEPPRLDQFVLLD